MKFRYERKLAQPATTSQMLAGEQSEFLAENYACSANNEIS